MRHRIAPRGASHINGQQQLPCPLQFPVSAKPRRRLGVGRDILGSMMWLAYGVFRFLLVGGGLVLFLLAGIPLCTWIYVELRLSRASATVIERRQDTFDRSCGSWHESLQLHVEYTPSDRWGPEQAWITVDEGTFVQSQAGSRVE